MRYVDLTHPLSKDTPVYPGDPPVELEPTFSLENEGYFGYTIKIDMHVGTHIDAPAHFIKGGNLISDYPVEKFFGRGVLVDARGKLEIGADVLSQYQVKAKDIVLICTGWDKKYQDPDYYRGYPEMTKAFAESLIELQVNMVGLDFPSPDRQPYEIHKILLPKDILILENLTNLEQLLPYKNFEIISLPAKFAAEAAPCRVVAKIE